MELILGGIIIVLLTFIYLREKAFVAERREFLNAIMSKNSIEFSTATAIVNPTKPEKAEEVVSEYIPEGSLSDEDFLKAIDKTIKN